VKRLMIVLAIMGLAFSVQAQDVDLRADHPREYIVQEGDTLWDIATRFLNRPWQWPAIWQANPQIDNPHLIYPGDRISLEFVGGEPRLMVGERAPDDSIRRLSPDVRRQDIVGPITTIPYDAMAPFLRKPRILGDEDLDALPYVVTNQDGRTLAGPGDRSFVRGLEDARVGDEVIIARVTYQFQDRSKNGDASTVRRNRIRQGPGQVPHSERPAGRVWQATFGKFDRFNYPIIGYELWESARARVILVGDPTVVELVEGRREVMTGDYILPVEYDDINLVFEPRAMDSVPDHGRVLTISEAYYGVGHYQIVAISLGRADGVAPGHMFSAFRPGETIRDNVRYPLMSRAAFRESDRRYVDLPEEYAGNLMVFRAFEHISYAIILGGTDVVRVDDRLYHPDRRL
jgi:hypothetical protein